MIETKPVQKPHPPIYMAAFVPAALGRIARLADGWDPVAIPVDGMQKMFDGLKQMAKEAGRDPAKLQLVVRANVEIGTKPWPKDGMIFTGTLEQVREDIEGCKRIGAHELHFDPTFMPGAHKLDRWLRLMEESGASSSDTAGRPSGTCRPPGLRALVDGLGCALSAHLGGSSWTSCLSTVRRLAEVRLDVDR